MTSPPHIGSWTPIRKCGNLIRARRCRWSGAGRRSNAGSAHTADGSSAGWRSSAATPGASSATADCNSISATAARGPRRRSSCSTSWAAVIGEQGFALEACRELVRHAFDELRLERIATCTAVENERSINLLKRLGMRIELDVTEPGGVLATLENPKN
jgi:hypothetical protein